MILAIDTSTPVCSVVLEIDGNLVEKRSVIKGAHSEKLFLFVDQLFSENGIESDDLDALLFCDGPGSYTGLRIGAAAIKGLLFEVSVPLFTLHSLHSIAIGAIKAQPAASVIHSVIDARRKHLYHQKFVVHNRLPVPESKPDVREIEIIRREIEEGDLLAGTGTGRLLFKEREGILREEENVISAANLIRHFQSEKGKMDFKEVEAADFEPYYLTMNQVNNNRV